MSKDEFLDLCELARREDVDALRLESGWSPAGRHPALLLRGSTFGGRVREVVICTARVRPGDDGTGPAFERLGDRCRETFGKWLKEYRHREAGRRFRLANLTRGD